MWSQMFEQGSVSFSFFKHLFGLKCFSHLLKDPIRYSPLQPNFMMNELLTGQKYWQIFPRASRVHSPQH